MTVPFFRLRFDGPALKEHEIDIIDLAPALLGASQMIRAANYVVNGDAIQVSVKVRTAGDGSFWIEMVIRGQSVWGSVKDFISGSEGEAVKKVLQFVGVAGGPTGKGAIWLVKKIKGRRTVGIDRRERWTEIKFDDETIQVEEHVARIAYDLAFRKALEHVVVGPLTNNGITDVIFEGDNVEERITAEEANAFLTPPVIEDDIFETFYNKVFSIVDLSFKSGKKWRLSDGHGRAALVDMEDRDFINRIENSEVAFAKGDILLCQVRETARQTQNGLKADYAIVRVIDHRRGGTTGQIKLNL